MLKKLIFCLAGAACISLLLPTTTIANGSWIINRSHTVLTIADDGEVKIRETVTVNFGENLKTGISRQIPLKFSIDDNVWFAELTDLTVQRNQVDEPFTIGGDDSHKVIEVGDTRLDLSGEQTYTFEYKAKGVLRHNGESDVLHWNTTGGWETTVEQATAVVILPKEGLVNQHCQIRLTSSDVSKDKCQSVGLSPTESRHAATVGLRPNESMSVQAEFEHGLVPVKTVRPPSLLDWIEVYRQPLLILSSISTICLLSAGFLWLKARRVRKIVQGSALDKTSST